MQFPDRNLGAAPLVAAQNVLKKTKRFFQRFQIDPSLIISGS